MGETNPELNDALKRLSMTKFGKPRNVVEKDIFDRLGKAEAEKKARIDELRRTQQGAPAGAPSGGSSFLDEWLSKRQQLGGSSPKPVQPQGAPISAPLQGNTVPPTPEPTVGTNESNSDGLRLRGDDANHQDEVVVKLNDH